MGTPVRMSPVTAIVTESPTPAQATAEKAETVEGEKKANSGKKEKKEKKDKKRKSVAAEESAAAVDVRLALPTSLQPAC